MTDWDLRRLRVLRALGEHGTVRAAAEALQMTPSAVSQQLAALSRQVGTALLEAHGRRVRLTDAGHVLLRHTDQVFSDLERAEAELEGFVRGDAGRVTVGAFATAVPALVVPAATDLRRRHPGLELRIREAEAAEAYELLAAGEVDLALSLAADAPSPRDAKFERTTLLADPMYAALPAHHRLAAAPGLRLADLAREPWIFGSSGPWRDITLTACANAGFTPEQTHVAADWEAILAMVAAGMGVALVPRMAAPAPRPGAAVRELHADRPRRHVVAAVRSGSGDRPRLARVLRALQRAAAEHAEDSDARTVQLD
ncbi:LysR family transcriptional regulator [Nocardiopsis composta]|uniref:DNA-binding transcriptional LysR family regulator n=1 Tax=Nocardiopsis composta TaxID=157465 RepID=A0A7W8QM76_9ACTN|nr:LysR family transcriptional regulator [Nocardiopsis composta]MBB5432569.1 DNA-binding transcriptional LysR family regulator [Nocardiopsis composta]